MLNISYFLQKWHIHLDLNGKDKQPFIKKYNLANKYKNEDFYPNIQIVNAMCLKQSHIKNAYLEKRKKESLKKWMNINKVKVIKTDNKY